MTFTAGFSAFTDGLFQSPAKPSLRPPCVPHRHIRRAVRASEAERPVRNLTASPVSSEGDHFPQTPKMEIYVLSPSTEPIPPRRHDCRCIRDGTGGIVGMRLEGGDEILCKGLDLLRERSGASPAFRWGSKRSSFETIHWIVSSAWPTSPHPLRERIQNQDLSRMPSLGFCR